MHCAEDADLEVQAAGHDGLFDGQQYHLEEFMVPAPVMKGHASDGFKKRHLRLCCGE